MDYSYLNTAIWNPIISFGVLSLILLVSNLLLRKIPFLRRLLIPTAVMAGFVALGLKLAGLLDFIDPEFLEAITYHGIAIGFIAMSLRVPNESEEFKSTGTGLRSGAIIIGGYVIQALTGLAVSLLMMKDIFPAAGILLPMGYGQGPGQANNVGTTYENAGFKGGHAFGLSIAAAGYLCACTVGVIIIFILRRMGRIKKAENDFVSGLASVDTFQDQSEIPISQSIDRFTVQTALVLAVYLVTYLVTYGITAGLSKAAPGVASTVNSLLWGFNFIIGSAIAMLLRTIFRGCRRIGLMKRQYPNNYLLSRLSGTAFDIMIVCGIAAIDISDLSGLWKPFVVMAAAGCAVTALYLFITCRHTYKGYAIEAFLGMFGMQTGTISSGIVLLREADPEFNTPAANNLVTGSSFAILLGAPMMLLVGLAYQPGKIPMTLGLLAAYFAAMMLIIFIGGGKKKKAGAETEAADSASADDPADSAASE